MIDQTEKILRNEFERLGRHNWKVIIPITGNLSGCSHEGKCIRTRHLDDFQDYIQTCEICNATWFVRT